MGSARTRSKQHAVGKDKALKRLPLRQLQLHATTPNLLAGEAKTCGEVVKQVAKVRTFIAKVQLVEVFSSYSSPA